jgi:hypothetical protein
MCEWNGSWSVCLLLDSDDDIMSVTCVTSGCKQLLNQIVTIQRPEKTSSPALLLGTFTGGAGRLQSASKQRGPVF